MKKISVIGLGYVGLTTAACFASKGHQVFGIDIEDAHVENLKANKFPFFENGLEDLISVSVNNGNLSFTTLFEKAISESEFIFLCLPTPQAEDGSANLTYIKSAIDNLVPFIKPSATIITKSTVPVGTSREIQKLLREIDAPNEVEIVSNPEFLREGTAVRDMLNPVRVVIGSDSSTASNNVRDLYEDFDAPILITDLESAELIKYASNTFLASKLAFINEISRIADAYGADINTISYGMGLDPRIGSQFLSAGPGYGGSCLPKDVSALSTTASRKNIEVPLIDSIARSNEEQFNNVIKMADRASQSAGKELSNSTVAVWGLAFKAGTNDLRDSPACEIVKRLTALGVNIRAYDPKANSAAKSIIGDAAIVEDMYETLEGCDFLMVLTEWKDFSDADFGIVKKKLNSPIIVDTRNIIDTSEENLLVLSLGRSAKN